MSIVRSAALAALLGLTAACGGPVDRTIQPGAGAAEALQRRLIEAKPGDIVTLAAGRFEFTDGLSLDQSKVTIRGAGPAQTILSFKGQTGAGEGLLVTGDDVTLEGFAVEDTKGDGIKSKGADRITYRDLRVEWTRGPDSKNGAYGVYPVESKDVLIERVTVRGASDAGIYVGQSRNIIVRDSRAELNVAGIEIENSSDADVHRNVVTRNTGGILVFDLPDLPVKDGRSIRVFDNEITDNDTPNFAPPGNIVASVPSGTGIMVMAASGVHVFRNRLQRNRTAHVLVAAYFMPVKDTAVSFTGMKYAATNTCAVRLRCRRFRNTCTPDAAITMMPVPLGTLATMLPGGAKFGVSLSVISLSNTRIERPSFTGRSGRSNTRMPPVLRVTTLRWTSASEEFSISMPATLSSARLSRTMMLRDCPT